MHLLFHLLYCCWNVYYLLAYIYLVTSIQWSAHVLIVNPQYRWVCVHVWTKYVVSRCCDIYVMNHCWFQTLWHASPWTPTANTSSLAHGTPPAWCGKSSTRYVGYSTRPLFAGVWHALRLSWYHTTHILVNFKSRSALGKVVMQAWVGMLH